ncbi:Ger(x)C family spore germination protein [Cohnella zeiphila]|uniref:Ger(x)C family spore germination protein n=1 Tax=Cohnella zeiphila TaxID=2761120 RepID=UPI001EE3175A
MEIEDRAVVLGISVDTVEPSEAEHVDEITHLPGSYLEPGRTMIRLGVQIAVPGRIPLGPGEGGGGGRSASNRTVWVMDVPGYTVDDALMNLQQQLSGELFLGHVRVIVVSEAMARKGLQNLNDYLRRNPQLRRMAWMMVSKGNALEFMKSTPELERIPTLYLMATMDSAVRMGKFPANYIGMFWSRSSRKGQEGYLPYVEMKKEQNVEIKGLAYFQKDRFVGVTSPIEISSYMSIMGMNPGGYRGLFKIGNSKQVVNIGAYSRKSQIKVDIRNKMPHFTVNVFDEFILEEKNSEDLIVNDPKLLMELNKKVEESVSKHVKGLIEKTQRAHSDIFGFGEQLRAKKPGYWRKYVKSKEKWEEMYENITVEIHIECRIRRIGMKAK